jgi:hypothetical protein
MRRLRVLALAVVGTALAGGPAQALTYLGSVRGNVNQLGDLLQFSAISSVSGLSLLGVYDSSQQDPGFSFPTGNPLGATTGQFAFQGGTPVFYTVKASNVTGLYAWMPNGGNGFDTTQFTPGRGFSNVRVWGQPGPAIPEPGAFAVFGAGALLVAAALRRRRSA